MSNTTVHPALIVQRPSAALRIAKAAPRRLRALWHAYLAHRQAVADERAFHQLDRATLRDLGMSRSEYGSYWAEAYGEADHTRQRVIRMQDERLFP